MIFTLPAAANQLLTVLNKIKAEAVLAAHPVGSLYWTSKNENPAVTFGGGTWKQITDKFVLAAGSTYKAEATGGAATVALTVANLPAHSHTFTPSGTVKSTFTGTSHSHTFTPSGTVSGGAYKFTGTKGTTSLDGQHSHTYTAPKTPENKLNPDRGSYAVRGTSNLSTSYDGKHAHSFTPAGSISVTTNPSFSGTAGTTGSTTQNGSVSSTFTGTGGTTGSTTQDGTVSSSFTGNSGNTGSVGSGSSISIMPPYVVKYCWERTA